MTSFSELNLDPKVLKAIEATGYTTPTPIQAGAIAPALAGRDVLGIAQTGTGKTAAFTLPMITLLAKGRARARMPRSLVLAPTRELAAQVAENFDTYAAGSRLKKALLIGGVSFKEQDRLIDRGVDVLIATPGRLIDHHERGKLLLTGVEIMVVDEADRMLDMGFIPDIERIFEMTPFTRQTLFFSATMAPEIERITNKFLSNPEKIEVERQNSTSETITQVLVEHTPKTKAMSSKDKREILRAIIDRDKALAENPLRNAIIFCNRKVDVDVVAKFLRKESYNAEPIHGDLDQSHRTRTLDGFRDGSITFLVASDVAARGSRHSQREPCVQLRRAVPRRGLCAPYRTDGSRGQAGHGLHHLRAFGSKVSRCHREPDQILDPAGRQPVERTGLRWRPSRPQRNRGGGGRAPACLVTHPVPQQEAHGGEGGRGRPGGGRSSVRARRGRASRGTLAREVRAVERNAWLRSVARRPWTQRRSRTPRRRPWRPRARIHRTELRGTTR